MQDVRSRFDLWFYELEPICRTANPWGFLCLSALIDYLTRLANGRETKGQDYIQFIGNHFPPRYKNFQYSTGKKDLPEQMYRLLRNGLVHSFSLFPDSKGINAGARVRSIVLFHAQDANAKCLSHLQHYTGLHGKLDAALFVAEEFLNDTKTAAYDLLQKAQSDSSLESRILDWFDKYPFIDEEK